MIAKKNESFQKSIIWNIILSLFNLVFCISEMKVFL